MDDRNRTILLVSDQRWQEVLSLVPIAIREDQWLPVLIYQQEGGTIDVDATLHFLCHYASSVKNPQIVHVGTLSAEIRRTLLPLITDRCGLDGDDRILEVGSVRQVQLGHANVHTWVVVAHDDYETGLSAAPFAALLDAHLCFLAAGDTLDAYRNLADGLETVYLIGELDAEVRGFFEDDSAEWEVHTRTPDEMRWEYLVRAGTDRVILVNPGDLELSYQRDDDTLVLEQTQGEMRKLYGRCSLVAPLLAAAKREFIVAVRSTTADEVKRELEEALTTFRLAPLYLTIVASPEAIPLSVPLQSVVGPVHILAFSGPGREHPMLEVDGRQYGSRLDGEGLCRAVGRIFGLTVSDCSAYVARALFFDQVAGAPEAEALMILQEITHLLIDRDGDLKIDGLIEESALLDYAKQHGWTATLEASFTKVQHITRADEGSAEDRLLEIERRLSEIERRYPRARLILFNGHASYDSLSFDTLGTAMSADKLAGTWLDGFPVILSVACSTAEYERTKIRAAQPGGNELKLARLLVAQHIRRGAMAQLGAVSLSARHQELGQILSALYTDGLSVGEAVRRAKNAERALFRSDELDNLTDYKVDGDPRSVLIGDPTWAPSMIVERKLGGRIRETLRRLVRFVRPQEDRG